MAYGFLGAARRAILVAWLASAPAWAALSGNAQVELAGSGQFEELAAGLEAQNATQAMKVADLHSLCYAYFRLKRYDMIFACLDRLEQSLSAHDKRTRLFGLDDATPTVYLMRAETQIEIGQYANAIEQAQQAIAWFVKDGSTEKDILVQALAAQVLGYKNSGQIEQAERAASQLAAVQVDMYQDYAMGAKSLALARVNMALGRWQSTLDALTSDKTLALRTFLDQLATGAFLRGINNWVWLELPRGYMQSKALFELGDYAHAKTGYDQILKVPQVVANGEIYWMSLADRAQLAAAEGDTELAIHLSRQALDVIERQRASIHTEANKIGFIGDKQAVYARLVELLFKAGRLPEAFEIVERAKSRALVDLLASKTNFGAPRDARDSKIDIVELINEKNRNDFSSLVQSASAVRSASSNTRPNSYKVALPSELQALVSVSALSPKEIQDLLAADESLLSYFSYGGRMFVLLVQKDRIVGQQIQTEGLENAIRKLRGSIAKQLPVDAQLALLYQRLIGPVAAQISGKRLSIVAHGALHYLPFSALYDGKDYLADSFNLRMLPSASVLKYIRPAGANDFRNTLILGNPDLQDSQLDLPGAQQEATTLAQQLGATQVLLRAQASKDAFMQWAPAAHFIHVASHGEFDSANPLSSALLLAAPTREQGRLTVSDLYQLGLNAEIVTLSACETGLGRVASGDDVVSLTRGFLYAGTSTVLASLWQVDDDSTTYLMTRFYHHLHNNIRGEALRLAQLDTRARYPHPFFWAPFYMTGAH
jgi:CHAT domain-containing protein